MDPDTSIKDMSQDIAIETLDIETTVECYVNAGYFQVTSQETIVVTAKTVALT